MKDLKKNGKLSLFKKILLVLVAPLVVILTFILLLAYKIKGHINFGGD